MASARSCSGRAARRLAMAAMRSLFSTLEARRILFTNPAAPLASRALQPPPVLPLDDTQRARLLGLVDEPSQRLIMLLAGMHALRPSQICALTLDAVGPNVATLLISGQARPLDQLTVQHLRAWLHTRRARRPATANPYLLIKSSTAGGVKPIGRSYSRTPSAGPASPPPGCAPTGFLMKPTPAAATRCGSPTCSGSATRPPSATAPSWIRSRRPAAAPLAIA
jgi:integrase